MIDGEPVIDLIMPVYNEGANIARALDEIDRLVGLPKRVLIVHDTDDDDTLPVVHRLRDRYPWAETLRNSRGRGVIEAIRAGIAATRAEVVAITMADLSDDVRIIPEMVRLIREGDFDIVCASRYMKGGQQIGGPRLKKLLSRAAGVSLHWLAGLPTHDATNAFRAYRREVLTSIPIESRAGFAYTLEVTSKAYARGYRITEIPSTWRDRSAGTSRFRLASWLPTYLRWYVYCLTHRPRRKSRPGA